MTANLMPDGDGYPFMERQAAINLLRRYVSSDQLISHCLATGAVMKATAVYLSRDAGRWETIGILHDIDFELVGGNMQEHGRRGAEILLEAGVDAEIAEIVKGHNHLLRQQPYVRDVEIALQAADSISGLVIACALVKGGALLDVTPKTVTKKVKEKSFAAGCDRSRIALIGQLIELPVFYGLAISGMQEIRDELGLH
jgi:putative nucleotidyltransferase with HDIG domain